MILRQLLLTRSSQPENVYGRFLAEILTSEGLTGFDCVDIETSGLPDLRPGDLVLLTRCFLRDAEIARLKTAVAEGTRLVCLQPSPRLAHAFGWQILKRVVLPGWIRIRQGYPGAGLPIQAHVPVSLHAPVDRQASYLTLADAVSADWAVTAGPAAIQQDCGKGKVALFFYDLPEAVARIRFGNPDLASYATTQVWAWPHAGDLFVGHIDERVKDLPQADFHGQLLAKALTDIAAYPLPRLWYYPEARHRSAAVFQSDCDMSAVAQFQELSECLLAHGGHATFYLMKGTHMTEELVGEFRAKGHTFAPHVNPHDCVDDWHFDFKRQLREETELFKKRFGACSPSLQCHCAPWQGYMDWVPEFTANGFRLLFAYLSVPMPFWQTYMCGSGRAMRFYDRNGTAHDCWQQPVIIYDDTTLIETIKKDPRPLIDRFERVLHEAVERTHTAIGILSHPVSFATYSRPFMEPCFDRFVREGMPIFNGDEWCAFLDRRAAARVTVQTDTRGGHHYAIDNLKGTMTLMAPTRCETAPAVRVNGKRVEGTVHRRLEEQYLFIPVEGDGHRIEVEAEGVIST